MRNLTRTVTLIVVVLCTMAATLPNHNTANNTNTNPRSAIYKQVKGHVAFTSDAPLELIKAETDQVQSVIDSEKQTFAFAIPIASFQGFNNPLQREHFNENYMETEAFPKATFSGKIIERVDFATNKTYKVRAKGTLNIHGVETERVIDAQIEVHGTSLHIKSTFSVPLADHDIKIPKIVNQKIATEIQVVVKAELIKQ